MVITSHIDGRIRVRDARLRQSPVLEHVRQKLLLRPDVRDVSSNPKVGSLLILYRTARHALQEIISLLAGFLGAADLPATKSVRPAPRRAAPTCWSTVTSRRVVNCGMLAALLMSLLAMAGSKQLHILAGLHFLGFLALHLFQKRHTLLDRKSVV